MSIAADVMSHFEVLHLLRASTARPDVEYNHRAFIYCPISRAQSIEEIARHYKFGAPANWTESFISEYASMHPWEDFAETWAHYLHIVDTLETAAAFRLGIQ